MQHVVLVDGAAFSLKEVSGLSRGHSDQNRTGRGLVGVPPMVCVTVNHLPPRKHCATANAERARELVDGIFVMRRRVCTDTRDTQRASKELAIHVWTGGGRAGG